MKAANKVFATIKFTYICCKRSITGSFLLVKGSTVRGEHYEQPKF